MTLTAEEIIDDAIDELIFEQPQSKPSTRIPLVNRSSLKIELSNCSVEIDDVNLAAMTSGQAELLWDWMEQFEQLDDSEILEWKRNLPDFMREESGEDDLRFRIFLKEMPVNEPAAADVEAPAALDSMTETSSDSGTGAPTPFSAADQLQEIQQSAMAVKKFQDEHEAAASELKSAKAHEKECQEKLNRAMAEHLKICEDSRNGQGRLPFGDFQETAVGQPLANSTPETSPAATTHPISDLSQKSIKTLVGADEFAAAKDRDDPIGLTDTQIEKLIEVEIETVEQLEQRIREDAFWHRKISGFGEKAVDRLTSTLVAFRQVKPVSESEK